MFYRFIKYAYENKKSFSTIIQWFSKFQTKPLINSTLKFSAKIRRYNVVNFKINISASI